MSITFGWSMPVNRRHRPPASKETKMSVLATTRHTTMREPDVRRLNSGQAPARPRRPTHAAAYPGTRLPGESSFPSTVDLLGSGLTS
jgi:hypothetical protein